MEIDDLNDLQNEKHSPRVNHPNRGFLTRTNTQPIRRPAVVRGPSTVTRSTTFNRQNHDGNVEKLKLENNKLKKETSQLKNELKDQKREMKLVRDELAQSKEVSHLRLKTLTGENQRLLQKFENISANVINIKEKEEKYANIEKDIVDLNEKIIDLTQDRDTYLDELRESEHREEKLKKIIEEKYHTEHEIKDKCEELQTIVEEQKNQLDQTKTNLKTTANNYNTLRKGTNEKIAFLSSELETYKDSSERFGDETAQLTERLNVITKQLEETKEKLRKTEESLTNERNDWKIERNIQDRKTDNFIKDLQHQLKIKVQQYELLKSQLTKSPSEQSLTFNKKKEHHSTMASSGKSHSKRGWRVGDRVELDGNRWGVLKYIGGTSFADGIWYGVELDEPTGKHDGKVDDRRYFQARPTYGCMVRSHKIVGGEFMETNADGTEPFEWFNQLSEERRTDLLSSITESFSNSTSDHWTGLTELSGRFGLTELQLKQAHTHAAKKEESINQRGAGLFGLSGDPAEHLRWENQKLQEKLTYMERTVQSMLKESQEQKNIINRFIQKVEKSEGAAAGTLGRDLWIQMQDVSKQNEALIFQKNQLGLEVKRLFREKQDKEKTIEEIKSNTDEKIKLEQKIEKFKTKIENFGRVLAMKESTIRKLQRTKGGNSENRASKELWEENLDELENKSGEEPEIDVGDLDLSVLLSDQNVDIDEEEKKKEERNDDQTGKDFFQTYLEGAKDVFGNSAGGNTPEQKSNTSGKQRHSSSVLNSLDFDDENPFNSVNLEMNSSSYI